MRIFGGCAGHKAHYVQSLHCLPCSLVLAAQMPNIITVHNKEETEVRELFAVM
jgi:hypothetical protein